MSSDHPTTVESLCDDLRAAAAATQDTAVRLWVPDEVTLDGAPVPSELSGIVAATLTDTALALGMWPEGSTAGENGRTYLYRRD